MFLMFKVNTLYVARYIFKSISLNKYINGIDKKLVLNFSPPHINQHPLYFSHLCQNGFAFSERFILTINGNWCFFSYIFCPSIDYLFKNILSTLSIDGKVEFSGSNNKILLPIIQDRPKYERSSSHEYKIYIF